MDVCLRVSVLCWTDPPTKESYQMSVDRKSIKEGQGSIRTVEASWKKKIHNLHFRTSFSRENTFGDSSPSALRFINVLDAWQ
jgi:hypothetical protein